MIAKIGKIIKPREAEVIDYFIRDVGRVLLPEDQYGKTELHDQMLTDPAFSIQEVTKASLKVLGDYVGRELIRIDNKEKNQLKIYEEYVKNKKKKTLYKAILNRPTTNKCIVLFDENNKEIACSRYQPPDSTITFVYQDVEYFQTGYLGHIYTRYIN
jgi:hypothetical protein